MKTKVDYEAASGEHPKPLSDDTEELLAMLQQIEHNWNKHEDDDFFDSMEIPEGHQIGEEDIHQEEEWKMDPDDLLDM